jgi:hypothetical protein
MLDNICQTYHCTLDYAMTLTVPQLLLISHAGKVNSDRMHERIERDRKAEERRKERDKRDPVASNGKRMSEMTMDELLVSQREFSK